jgi:hypothetical protein
MREAMRGQADDLGGGVFKKRLNDNQHRSIVLAKGGKLWVFAFLYAKKDRANIDPDELAAFRKLAQAYARITPLGNVCKTPEQLRLRGPDRGVTI